MHGRLHKDAALRAIPDRYSDVTFTVHRDPFFSLEQIQ